MIKTEYFEINGRAFIRAYSDAGMMVERDGVMYSEANDPAEFGRVYTETDVAVESEEATEADYVDALKTLGVDVDG